MLTFLRSNTLRIQEIDGNFTVISFPEDLFPKKHQSHIMIIFDLPELLQIVIVSYLIQGLRIQRFSMSPNWIQLFSSRGDQCLHPVYKSSATHVQKLTVI
jgi:hypothetical protein